MQRDLMHFLEIDYDIDRDIILIWAFVSFLLSTTLFDLIGSKSFQTYVSQQVL